MEDNTSTQVCCRCKVEKPIESFNFKNRRTGKRQYECRDCHRDYNRQHYKNNRQSYLDNSRDRNRQTSDDNFEGLLEYLSRHPCVDCGESNPIVLDFDHVDRNTKLRTVSSMMRGYNWETVMAEISKCDVRCANCHRIRTAQQFGWRKLLAA